MATSVFSKEQRQQLQSWIEKWPLDEYCSPSEMWALDTFDCINRLAKEVFQDEPGKCEKIYKDFYFLFGTSQMYAQLQDIDRVSRTRMKEKFSEISTDLQNRVQAFSTNRGELFQCDTSNKTYAQKRLAWKRINQKKGKAQPILDQINKNMDFFRSMLRTEVSVKNFFYDSNSDLNFHLNAEVQKNNKNKIIGNCKTISQLFSKARIEIDLEAIEKSVASRFFNFLEQRNLSKKGQLEEAIRLGIDATFKLGEELNEKINTINSTEEKSFEELQKNRWDLIGGFWTSNMNCILNRALRNTHDAECVMGVKANAMSLESVFYHIIKKSFNIYSNREKYIRIPFDQGVAFDKVNKRMLDDFSLKMDHHMPEIDEALNRIVNSNALGVLFGLQISNTRDAFARFLPAIQYLDRCLPKFVKAKALLIRTIRSEILDMDLKTLEDDKINLIGNFLSKNLLHWHQILISIQLVRSAHVMLEVLSGNPSSVAYGSHLLPEEVVDFLNLDGLEGVMDQIIAEKKAESRIVAESELRSASSEEESAVADRISELEIEEREPELFRDVEKEKPEEANQLPELKIAGGEKVRNLLDRLKTMGFEKNRQKGSHTQWKHTETGGIVTVPLHSQLKKGTAKSVESQVAKALSE